MQNIRRADESVTQHGAGLDFVTDFAKFLYARPDGCASEAESLGKFRAAHATILRRAERHQDLRVSRHARNVGTLRCAVQRGVTTHDDSILCLSPALR